MSVQHQKQTYHPGELNPWMLWVTFFSSILIFVSLWLINRPEWHLVISLATIALLWYGSEAPLKTLSLILSLVLFLALMQLLFSSFMRDLLLRSLNEGFKWAEWQYLLLALERLAWPLMIVSIFRGRLNSPLVAAHISKLLLPLNWLGFRIGRLQTVILLALRFMPALQKEWQRFSYFQTYFSSRQAQRTLIQRLNYVQGVLKALISHTISRAVSTGDMLALRGLPASPSTPLKQAVMLPGLIWFPLGLLAYAVHSGLFLVWLLMTAWLGLTAAATYQQDSA